MPHSYTTLAQFLEAYDAQPIIYAKIQTGVSSYQYLALTGLVIIDAGGNRTAYQDYALSFGGLAEIVSQSIESSQIQLQISGYLLPSSQLGNTVEIYLGDTNLRGDRHLLLFTGTVLSENRSQRTLTVAVQDKVFLTLQKQYTPQNQIKDEFPALTLPDALEKYAPIVIGQLLSTGTAATGRIRAIPITNVIAGSNDFLVCEHEFGQPFTVHTVWKNGVGTAFASAEVNGTAFDYIKVTINPSNPTDDITVDITRRTINPMTELRYFLNRLGIADTQLDLTSFTDAQTVCSSRNYKLGGKIEKPQQALQVIREYLESFNAEIVLSGGDLGVRIQDYTYDFSAPDFVAFSHMYEGSINASRSNQAIVNSLVYEALYNPDDDPLLQGVRQDSTSISTYGLLERGLSFHWAGDSITADDAAWRYVFDNRNPRQKFSFRTFLKGLSVSLLDSIRITAEGLSRRYFQITRRAFEAPDFSIIIEALDIDDLVQDAFRLGADQSKAADIPHNLPANDPRNCNVTGSIDDGGTLTTGAGTDTLTRTGGVSFVTRGVVVGDFVSLQEISGGGAPVNLGVYEIYEGAKIIGSPITTANTLTVEDPNTGAAVSFTGAEVITKWWIARCWATADDDQRRQGYITKNDGTMSDGSAGKVLV